MFFNKYKVSTRLMAGFGIVLIISIIIAALGISKLAALNESLIVTVDFNAQEANIISQALGESQKSSSAMRNLIVLSDMPRMKLQQELFDNSLIAYDKAMLDLEKLFKSDPNTSPEEKNYLLRVAEMKAIALPLIKKAAAQIGRAHV